MRAYMVSSAHLSRNRYFRLCRTFPLLIWHEVAVVDDTHLAIIVDTYVVLVQIVSMVPGLSCCFLHIEHKLECRLTYLVQSRVVTLHYFTLLCVTSAGLDHLPLFFFYLFLNL